MECGVCSRGSGMGIVPTQGPLSLSLCVCFGRSVVTVAQGHITWCLVGCSGEGGVFCGVGGVFCSVGGVFCGVGGVFCRVGGVFCGVGGVFCRVGGVFCGMGGVFCGVGDVILEILNQRRGEVYYPLNIFPCLAFMQSLKGTQAYIVRVLPLPITHTHTHAHTHTRCWSLRTSRNMREVIHFKDKQTHTMLGIKAS